MPKKSVSLAVGRGEKLPVSKGAGLTAKGRAKYNRETGSNLKAPAPNPKTKADAGRKKSFFAASGDTLAFGVDVSVESSFHISTSSVSCLP